MLTTGAPTRVQWVQGGQPAAPAPGAAFERRRQQRIVATGDAVAITLAFAFIMSATVAFGGIRAGEVVYTVVAAGIGLLSLRTSGMWNAHKLAVRSAELAGIARATVSILAGVVVLDRFFGPALRLRWIIAAAVLAFAFLVVWRSLYRSWLAVNRRQGRLVRTTLIVGTDQRAIELVRIAEVHPEAGTQIVGIVGSKAEAEAAGRGDLWIAELGDLAAAVADAAPHRIVVSSNDIDAAVLAGLIRAEHRGGAEVVLHAGLPGFDASRVSISTMANEAMLHVESATPSLPARALKRAFDIVVAGALLVVASPVLAVVAVLVKKEDRGPVFFRQQRVGLGDAEFGMLKFRTMCVDAEARLAAVQADNQRSGPLFKLARDPRVTRIGHVLRRTSLDELPQLLNVLKGDMSLVGPRPALRREVAEFPAELHDRHLVRPGITGLWQVEARDNPAFDAYQRLDLHYVENWSLGLDVVILMATAEQLLMRPFASKQQGEMAVSEGDPAFATAA
jgi:exopolysaccharide biosynthesis polyprenyl glycosylphosphotransferase